MNLTFPVPSLKNIFQVRAERNKAVEESRQVMIKSVTHLHTQLCICNLFGSKFAFAFVYDSMSDLGEIRVYQRADFQSGSRVLKKVF